MRSWHPNRISRRQALAVGAGGLTAPLLRLLHVKADSRPTSISPRADACILVYLAGGPSHVDIWDMKPDATADIRGEFRPIATRIPGIHICEHMPRLAGLMQHCAIVRSVNHDVRGSHGAAAYVCLTGHNRGDRPINRPSSEDYPAIGSVMGTHRPPRSATLPYVWMPTATTEGGARLCGMTGGVLGPAHDPFFYNPEQSASSTPLALSSDINAERLEMRMRLLNELAPAGGAMVNSVQARDLRAFQEKATDLITSPAVQRAFQIELEPENVRDAYGDSVYGESALIARRLIEAGTRVACVAMAPNPNSRWDAHINLFGDYRRILLPELDSALSSLIRDLADRRLLERTLIVAMGEFGRAPRITPYQPPNEPGRDHWSRCYSILLAGGGIKGGYVYGASDRIGAEPARCPVSPADVIATIYRCLGIPHDMEVLDRQNRPRQLVPGGNPITDLLS